MVVAQASIQPMAPEQDANRERGALALFQSLTLVRSTRARQKSSSPGSFDACLIQPAMTLLVELIVPVNVEVAHVLVPLRVNPWPATLCRHRPGLE